MKNPDQKGQNAIIQGYIKGNTREFFIITNWIDQVVDNFRWALKDFREDIVQEVRLKVYINLKENKFRKVSQLRTYVCRIAKYTCIDYLRKTYTHSESDLESEDIKDEDNALDRMIHVEKEKLINIILNEIAEMCREVLEMVFREKLSYNEISIIMNVAEGTVKSRVSRCIKKAIELKDKYWNEPQTNTTIK